MSTTTADELERLLIEQARATKEASKKGPIDRVFTTATAGTFLDQMGLERAIDHLSEALGHLTTLKEKRAREAAAAQQLERTPEGLRVIQGAKK